MYNTTEKYITTTKRCCSTIYNSSLQSPVRVTTFLLYPCGDFHFPQLTRWILQIHNFIIKHTTTFLREVWNWVHASTPSNSWFLCYYRNRSNHEDPLNHNNSASQWIYGQPYEGLIWENDNLFQPIHIGRDLSGN